MQSNPCTLTHRLNDIIPAQAMQISVSDDSGETLELTAPLPPNLNDKGTAFAGSITSLLVLAGWGLITQRLQEAGIQAEVVVSKSETDYQRPIRSDMFATAKATSEQMAQLIVTLKNHPRGSILIQTTLVSAGKTCATMTATYVAAHSIGRSRRIEKEDEATNHSTPQTPCDGK